MKKTKRVLALLLTLIMLFSLFVPGSVASAAGEDVLVVETVSAAGEAGGTVTVDIKITQNPGVVGFALQVDYDSSKLTLKSEPTIRGLMGGSTTFSENLSVDPYVVVFDSTTSEANITATGTLMSLDFEIAEDAEVGDTPITLSFTDKGAPINFNLGPVECETRSGVVTISRPDAETPLFVLSSAEGEVGEIVDVTLAIQDNPGIIAAELEISYDKDKLELVSVTDAKLLGGYVGSETYSSNPYYVSWLVDNTAQNNTANGTLATFRFKIKDGCAAGTTAVSAAVKKVKNSDLQSVEFGTVNGVVTINRPDTETPLFVLSSAEGEVGETVDVTLAIQDNPGIIAAELEISYDKDKLELVGVTDTKLLGGYVGSETYSSNPYYVSWLVDNTAQNNTANGTLATFRFKIKDGCAAGTTAVSAAVKKVKNSDLQLVEFGVVDGVVTVAETEAKTPLFVLSSAEGKAGETVDVTLAIQDNPGIIAAELEISYDKDKLELVGVTDAKLLGGYVGSETYSSNPYYVSWLVDDTAQNNTANGTLATLSFKIKDSCAAGTAAVSVAVKNAKNSALQSVEFDTVDGIVTVNETQAPAEYNITIGSMTNGSVVTSAVKAAAGVEITLTVTPAEGYELAELSVTSGGSSVAVVNNKFTMPAGDVTVAATFKVIESDFAALEGAGTESIPYLLKTEADFIVLRTAVNEAGNKCEGMYFKMANDITLSENWESIGSDGPSANEKLYFSGTLDGGGYQLSYAKGSKPLFEYVSRATVKNMKIYGVEIQGCGLINNCVADRGNTGVWLDNIILVSGTSTLEAGLVRGANAATPASNPTYITNCHAEEGVVIGYDKTKSGIGTFACGFVGNIENCSSAATVYGVDNVGGIVGYQTNAMGKISVKNCAFTGKIVAAGSIVGGIVASGYTNNTAANALCVTIENCYTAAEITGADMVGGIFGGEKFVEQCWANGIGYIRNNHFYGSLTATAHGGRVGGIIGYMSSLNRYNVIENNYYYDANGTAKAIGGVEHIDTSAREFGKNNDGIFYYDTSKDRIEDIKDFVDAEDKGTADWEDYTSVSKTDHNRSDDPIGADSDKLGKAMTIAQFKDGTVLELLNAHENSSKNWVQGGLYPVFGNELRLVSIAVSGNYKTQYSVGDSFDTTGMVITATWSDNSNSIVNIKDVSFTGFDSSRAGTLQITVTYESVSVQIEISVRENGGGSGGGGDESDEPEEITIRFSLKTHKTTWIPAHRVTLEAGATVADAFHQVLDNRPGFSYVAEPYYVRSITYNGQTLGEFDEGPNSGWKYMVNGVAPSVGMLDKVLEDGDELVWYYVTDYTEDTDRDEGGGGGGAGGSEEKEDEDNDEDDTTDTPPANSVVVAPEATVSGDKAIANVGASDIAGAIEEAKKDETVTNVTIAPEVKGDVNNVTVELPKNSVGDIAESGLGLTVETDIADVKLPSKALEDVSSKSGQKVSVSTEKTESGAVSVEIAVDGKAIDKVNGGVVINLPAEDTGKVLVIVNEDGSETVVKKSVAGADGVSAVLEGSATVKLVDNKKEFNDTEKHWGASAIDFATSRELFNGVDEGVFDPDGTMTRAMLVTVLHRLEGEPEHGGHNHSFEDVPHDQWYSDAVAWANELGIVEGHSDEVFDPHGEVTREQIAVILHRYAEYLEMSTHHKGDITQFHDHHETSDWALGAETWAVGAGLINGKDGNRLDPTGDATRAEVATILERLVGLMVE